MKEGQNNKIENSLDETRVDKLECLPEGNVIKHYNGMTRFDIIKNHDCGATDKLKINVQLDDLVGEFIFDPESCVRDPVLTKFKVLDIAAIQVIPVKETADSMRYRLIVGTDNGCCNGALLYMDYLFKKGEHNVIEKHRFLNGVNIPFSIGGLIGTANEVFSSANRLTGGAIVYGQGCSGYGIRIADFSESSLVELMSTKDARRVTRHANWTHKPVVNEGKLWVPRRRTDDMQYSLRYLNLGNGVCIDDKFNEARDCFGKDELLQKIKDSAAKSLFLYGREHKPAPAFERDKHPIQKKLKLLVGDDRFGCRSDETPADSRAAKSFMQEYESILGNVDVTFVARANEMIGLAARTEYDALMIDLNWGYDREEDGYRILDAVSQYAQRRILWTGAFSDEVKKKAKSNHATACIPKYLAPEDLDKILRE